jgi:hypothetical protein
VDFRQRNVATYNHFFRPEHSTNVMFFLGETRFTPLRSAADAEKADASE